MIEYLGPQTGGLLWPSLRLRSVEAHCNRSPEESLGFLPCVCITDKFLPQEGQKKQEH